MITFAIVAHNEAPTVATVVSQAIAAAEAGDRVLVVDSGSTDDTSAQAHRAGAEVLTAPVGKGRAMAAATEATRSPWICFMDADVPAGSLNYAARLRDLVDGTRADHVLGEYSDTHESVMSNTFAVYAPLVASLFPEAADRFGSKPLTGFRAVRRAFLDPGAFPPDFGIEAHLNLDILMSGGTHEVAPIGTYQSRFRFKPSMGCEIAQAVLDLAERYGRLAPEARPAWDDWAGQAIAVISGYHGGPDERPAFVRELTSLAQRPTPATR
jgi:glucosyl-3-phosphoglycerate synthase